MYVNMMFGPTLWSLKVKPEDLGECGLEIEIPPGPLGRRDRNIVVSWLRSHFVNVGCLMTWLFRSAIFLCVRVKERRRGYWRERRAHMVDFSLAVATPIHFQSLEYR